MSSVVKNKSRTRSAVEVLAVFLKLGLSSFGGPIAHLGYFRKEFVERRSWLDEHQFAQLLAICQFLPGPASSQLGFCIGLLRAGWLGALAAFVAFTLPSALLLIAFAVLLPALSSPAGMAAIHGLKLVACAVVADAVLGMSKKLCPDAPRQTIAILAFAALLILPGTAVQLAVVIVAAITGGLLLRAVTAPQGACTLHTPHGARFACILLAIFIALLIGLPLLADLEPSLVSVTNVFYNAGAMVFGGGHVVLPLLQDSVVHAGWISPEQFLAGYGASQAIPGPMFTFAGYLGALLAEEGNTWALATVALVFVFLPGFLLVAGILPLWRTVAHNPLAYGALAGVNAAVVGLLAAALYNPVFTSGIVGPLDLAIAGVAFGLITVWRLPALAVVAWCVAASLLKLYV